jgi:SNF2 family DNA or RNA helicase
MPKFAAVPSIYPKLLELRKSKTAEFKNNKYLKETTKLRYYQVVGSLHMMLLQRMVLGDGTGLGKSLQLIATFTFLLEKDPTLKLLIIGPKSATYQWQEEFEKFTNGITVRVLTNKYNGETGYNARKLQYEEFDENVLVTNYNPVLEEYETFHGILSPKYMVAFDECQSFKNYRTKTHIACKYLADHAERTYGLSATIIKNGLEEVWGIYNVVVPGLFGNITRFRKAYCKQKMMDLVIKGKKRKIPKTVGYKNLKEFKTVLDPYFLIRKKEDVASELPKLISKKVILEMLPEQRKLYKEALAGILYEEKVKNEFYEISEVVRNGADDERTLKKYEELREKYEQFLTPDGKKKGKLAALTYCQMVSNGPQLLGHAHESSKEQEFVRLMREELITDKVIVYTRFRSGIPALEVLCNRNNINYTQIHGGITSDYDRKQARLKFQNDPNCNLIFITQAGSAALNLQAASVLIFYDTPWSYGDLVQTIGRAQRIGSLREHIVILHMVNKNTIDERVITRVSSKKDLNDEIMGDTAAGALDFSEIDKDDNVIEGLFSDIMEDAENYE